MQLKHVPPISTKYWCALICASIFGANTGDFFAGVLKLGHLAGLPILAALFAITVLIEKRDHAKNFAYFWIVIVIVRTAATNLGDVSHDLKLQAPQVIAGLAVVLLTTIVAWRTVYTNRIKAGQDSSPGIIVTNPVYWFSMLMAGTLGTVIGDYFSFGLGFRPFKATILLGGLLALTFVLCKAGLKRERTNIFGYWLAVVLIRSAGTSAGDLLAHSPLRLPLSTLISGLFFVGLLWLWKDRENTNS
ncbi:MAG: hypothetical protein JWM03_694 [Rhodocyclales bacterium]|nr:hypothetical protein [Rhodocyclales bacterium]